MAGKRFLVAGRVQGVGYRHFAARAARSFGLTGWVRNLPEGTVEVQAWGSAPALDDLHTLLLKGPRFGEVANVEVSEISAEVRAPISFDIIG